MGRKRIYDTLEEAALANREKAAESSRDKSKSIKEIGPLPKVKNPKRKAKCKDSLLTFMMEYGGKNAPEECRIITSPYCEEQIYMINTLEDILKNGGEIPLCIFRGGCKTTFCEWGLFWACCYGWQKFGLVVAASKDLSRKIIANIKLMINLNTRIQEDFPEVCYPILKLERVNQRAAAQTLHGVPTEITYNADNIQFPRVANAASSQAIIYGVGAESSFRGLRVGKQRPTFILLDDPQTTQSANSITQTENRWENICGSMKGLAGPGVNLAMVATVTVIKPNDLAERILEKWGGKRFGILRSMPKNMDAWENYHEEMLRTRLEVSNVSERNRLMNRYYKKNRDILDEGAEATWESNYTPSEVSAIQHAMHLYFFDKKSFWSEYMNLPIDIEKDAENLTNQELISKIRKDLPKGIAPTETEKITAGIDVQKDCLYWMVVGWGDDFSGHVLEYGRYPKGKKTMQSLYPGKSLEEQVANCLTELIEILKVTNYKRESGEILAVDKAVVDAGWGLLNTQVKKCCKAQPHGFIEPTRGRGIKPNQRLMLPKKKVGELRGPEWRKLPLEIKGICRTIEFNANFWKSFVRNRLQAGIHARATLTFHAGDEISHAKLFRHLLAETSQKLTGQYGTIDEWTLKPGEPNHWLDCLVMNAVAASTLKIQTPEFHKAMPEKIAHEKKKIRWVEL